MSEPKGRGRARGQSRGRAAAQPAPGNVPGPAAATGPPLQGVWGRRPGAVASQPAAQPGPSITPAGTVQASGTAGRATHIVGVRSDATAGHDLVKPMSEMEIGDRGDGSSAGRGSMRGRRFIPSETLVTKPQGLVSKQAVLGDTQPMRLKANFFELLKTTDWCLYQYRVDLAPEEDRTMVRKALLKVHKAKLNAYIFDGTVLYTSNKLPQPLELFSKRESDSAEIRITIRLVGDLVKGDYHYLQFFNIIMRKCLGHLNLQLVGRDFYDPAANIDIRDYGLQLWPGYLTSIRQHERSILMCSEITHKVMRLETLYDVLTQCHQEGGDFKRNFSNKVIGVVVLTGYNNNTYRIDDVDFEVTPQSTFQLRTGQAISYLEYYKTKYQIKIRQATQPMLVSRTKPRERRAGQNELVYLVPELCRSTGLTDEMRSNFQLMKALATHTRVGPSARIAKLKQFNERLRRQPEVVADLKEWNLELNKELVDVPGRRLNPERIFFNPSDKRTVDAGPEADWTRLLRNAPMLRVGVLDKWMVVVTSRAKHDVLSFVQTLINCARGMSFQIAQPRIHEIPDDRSATYTNALEQVMSRDSPSLIFCVVPNNRADRYSAIKKKCCVDRPVPTQVFLARNLNSKGVQSIATKVAIQMNCKIGGAPWRVGNPLSRLMVVGFDVCHDTNSKGRDFGALVASLDPALSKYFSAVSAHTTGEELSNDLSLNMMKALHAYKQHNGGLLPDRIIIYRDGVGEGQIPYVFEHEVELLKQKLTQAYGSEPLRMAFIIVTKRINTRIFAGTDNPPPGTVVDDVITNPDKYDFFIISQSVRQGTVSPTAYSVIADTSALDADKIQRLTYKMTHMYYNWSGTVRVPAPCQYAHKLAFLVAQSIHRTPHNQLENLLYFL